MIKSKNIIEEKVSKFKSIIPAKATDDEKAARIAEFEAFRRDKGVDSEFTKVKIRKNGAIVLSFEYSYQLNGTDYNDLVFPGVEYVDTEKAVKEMGGTACILARYGVN